MAIYKPNMLDKFKDFVNGLKANWDDYETHKADYANKLETNGYQKFPGGLILQWGSTTFPNTNPGTLYTLEVTLPIAFPKAKISTIAAVATGAPEAADVGSTLGTGDLRTFNVHARRTTGGELVVRWLAIGC